MQEFKHLNAVMFKWSLLFKRDEMSDIQLANGKQPHVSPYTSDQYETEVSLNTTHLGSVK